MTPNGFYERYSQGMAGMKQRAPDIAKGFGAMFATLMKPGALSAREKELIALGIGVADRCEPCIWSHVEKCLKAGATPEQILEAAGVAVVMQGGPAYTYVPKVIEAIEHFQGAVPRPSAPPG
jgi:AhpD family alkylhydroperoxidase